MAITVTMIEEKEFKIKVRGYDPVEVDEFLDAICDEMEDMNLTIQQLKDQLKQQQASSLYMPVTAPPVAASAVPILPLVSTPASKPEMPSDLKSAKLLLERTQKACDEVLAEANKRAGEIVKKAVESLPDPELEDLEGKKSQLEKEIAELSVEAQKFRQRMQSMLKDQIDILDSELS
jgi:cell division initiation protein